MSRFLDIISGNFEPTQLIIWIIVQFGLCILFIYIAYRFHIRDNPYSIMTHSISFLGSWIPTRNPRGWWNLSIALSILGIMFFPLHLYYHRRMALISEWAAWIGTILCFLGSIGVILVAIVPDNEGKNFFKDLKYGQVHNVVATIGFGGFGFGNLWYGLMFFYDAIWGKKLYSPGRFLPSFLILLIIVLIIAYTQLKWEKMCKTDDTKVPFPGEGIYSFPLWEWILATYLFLHIYYVLISLPNALP
ncbi:MAG: hypothetical protein GF364_18700 [Candidatus Lokiarchaeota archaeon]|nr:hypothetical protein [Candidatus Lokiarchaeota archaeon]